MKKETPRRPNRPVRLISPKLGDGFFQQHFKGKSFLNCLKEVLKNARDWGASVIMIATDEQNSIQIVDDGEGMNGDNRDAVFSVNATTAKGERQSGKFCTGFKYLMHTFGRRIVIRTVSAEEPATVYVSALDVSEHESILLHKKKFAPDVYEKDATTWPYSFPTGTEITVIYDNPRSAAIRRGASLAKDLAAMLSTKLIEIITVDGNPLPPKEIVGEQFIETYQDPQIGEIGLDLYQPVRRSGDEQLLLTAGEIGEVPIRNFVTALGELRSRLGKTYQLNEVCGTITWHGLRNFVNEDRFTISGTIADSPLTLKFLHYLERVEPQVRQRLRIKIESSGDAIGESRDITPVTSLFNGTWGGTTPTNVPGKGGGVLPPGEVIRCESVLHAIQLDAERYEYELGETVRVTARIGRNYSFTIANLQWHTLRSRARVVRITPGELTMVAETLGMGHVTAEIPGTSHLSMRAFRFVTRRIPNLNSHHPEIEVGDVHPLILSNADLVDGQVEWVSEGVGVLTVTGNTATFTSNVVGHATVRVLAPTGRELDRCDITVMEPRQRALTIQILNYAFTVDRYMAEHVVEPVQIQFYGPEAKTHVININDASPSLRNLTGEAYNTTLALAILHEFARNHQVVSRGVSLVEMNPEDVPTLLTAVQRELWELYAEIQRTNVKRAGQ